MAVGLLSRRRVSSILTGGSNGDAMATRKKTPVEQAPKKYLTLNCDSYSYVTREADPEDSWGADDTATDWTVNGISLSDQDSQYALEPDFDVEVGDTVYVVYAVYSTGDTFHHASGAYLEVLSFHKNGDLAHQNASGARERSNRESAYTMTITYDSGAQVSRHCPWDGYFESLDYIQVDSFVVTGMSKRY